MQLIIRFTVLMLFVCSTQTMDLCNTDALRFHARNACSKLINRFTRSIDFSDYNITIVPGHKDQPHKFAKKLTHHEMPGAYILIHYPYTKRVHSKKHQVHLNNILNQQKENFNQEPRDVEITGVRSSDELEAYSYRHYKNLNRHHKTQHKNMGAFAYQHRETSETNENSEIDFQNHDDDNQSQYYLANDILTVGMPQTQRQYREVADTANSPNELRTRRQNVHIQKCCENPKLDECDWFLCD